MAQSRILVTTFIYMMGLENGYLEIIRRVVLSAFAQFDLIVVVRSCCLARRTSSAFEMIHFAGLLRDRC